MNTTLVPSINVQPNFWLKNLKDLQRAYNRLVIKKNEVVATNTNLTTSINNLTKKVNTFEGVDKKLANACKQVEKSHDSLNQAFEAHTVYKD